MHTYTHTHTHTTGVNILPDAHEYNGAVGEDWGGDQERVAVVLVDCTWNRVGGKGGPGGVDGGRERSREGSGGGGEEEMGREVEERGRRHT